MYIYVHICVFVCVWQHTVIHPLRNSSAGQRINASGSALPLDYFAMLACRGAGERQRAAAGRGDDELN